MRRFWQVLSVPLLMISSLLVSCVTVPKAYETFLQSAKEVAYTEDVQVIESFGDSILASLQSVTPDFADDFSSDQGWNADFIPSDAMNIENGKLVIKNWLIDKDMQAHIYNKVNQFNNFVAKIDFFFETNDNSYASFHWKASQAGFIVININSSGDVEFVMPHSGTDWNAAKYYSKSNSVVYRDGVRNSLLVISNHGNHAFYLNDKPAFFIHETVLPPSNRNLNKIEILAGSNVPNAILAFDNFMIWDLDKLNIKKGT